MNTEEEMKNISNGIKRFLNNNPGVLKQVLAMPSSSLDDLWQRAGAIYKAMDASHWVNSIGHYTFAHLANEALADVQSANKKVTDETN